MTDDRATIVTPVELALMRGDAKSLAPAERLKLVRQLADDAAMRWGGSPPVILVEAQGKLVPYITKGGADQLAALQGASIVGLDWPDAPPGLVRVIARARSADGRTNVDIGACSYDPERPATRERAEMVAATRARRRCILGLLGSGFAWNQAAEQAIGLEDPE